MLDTLRSLVEPLCTEDGYTSTPDPALMLFRAGLPGDHTTAILGQPLDDPALCVIVAGRKEATVGTRRVVYEAGSYTTISVDLPVTDMVVEAAVAEPFLAVRLAVDTTVLAGLVLELPAENADGAPGWGVVASPLSPDLADPLVRLLRALGDPCDARVLGPAIKREIYYRLLRGPHGSLLRELANHGSRLSQIKRAIDAIRGSYTRPLRVEALAQIARMSASSFYLHFKQVTGMSPLQYQKQLRLHEARRLILHEGADATTAGYAVGYESPSQFSREYKRRFGAPPIQDVARLRAAS